MKRLKKMISVVLVKGGEVGMNFCCENCGWSEIIRSPIILFCNYKGHRTWHGECCEAWKPKEKETNMVEVVRCKDCKHGSLYMTEDVCGKTLIECNRPDLGDVIEIHGWDWFCADGERR